jgi:hypothetical protein
MVRVAIPLARVVATADRENPAAREARHGA